jgi:Tol biopolymer transport system component
MVAFTSSDSQEDLYVAKADGSGMTQLTNDVAIDRVPQWSPDGRTIAYYSQKSGRFQVWTVQPDGLAPTQRTDAPDGASFFGGVWSPDGRELAVAKTFAAGLTADSTVFLIDAAARGESPSRELPGSTGFFPNSWSPDRQWIAGYTTRGMPMAFNLATREQRILGARGSAAVWLPDSRRLLYGSSEGLMVVDVVTGAARSIGPPTRWVSLSRDGRWLALVEGREEGDIWMMTREGK